MALHEVTAALGVLATDLDDVTVHFNDDAVTAMKAVIALVLAGVALDTDPRGFVDVARRPLPVAVGVVAQFVVLPALSVVLTILLGVPGSVALGMILVACCPPGNISNILTHRAGGDVALSVSMTAVSNLLTIGLLPLSLAFWGGLSPAASEVLRDIHLDVPRTIAEVALVIGLPFVAGVAVRLAWPRAAAVAHRVVGPVSIVLLALIVVGGFVGNIGNIGTALGVVAAVVVLQDTMALALGYTIARAFRLPTPARKAMTFEVGVRNTALGIVLVFAYFAGLGGMALVAAFWGFWDVLAGLALAQAWRRRTAPDRAPMSDGCVTGQSSGYC